MQGRFSSTFKMSAFNSMAVELGLAGRFEEAASLLSHGLFETNEYRSPDIAHFHSSATSPVANNNMVLHQFHLSAPQGIGQVSPANVYAFYPVLFSVGRHSHSVSAETAETFQEFTSAIMVHNLAVLCHRAAMSNGSTHELKRALRLYNLSARTLRLCTDTVSAVAILLISVANMAQIHSHFSNHAKAQGCFQCAFDMLLQVRDETLGSEPLYHSMFAHLSLCGHVSAHSPAA
mmetsp:Transcript_14746/g.30027  ORF Transcript_14746/g.30027 Transcript_14746/m.30027 type:complete len:233 (+) Transcript_14746:239-937(+)